MKELTPRQTIGYKVGDLDPALENKISYYHLAAFLVMLPFDRIYGQLILVSLVMHVLIHFSKEKLSSVLNLQTVILSAVFLLTLVGIAWSADKKEGMQEIERQLAIILFPIVCSATGYTIRQHRNKLLHVFGVTGVATILYLYGDAINIIFYNKLPLRSLLSPAFINHNFSEPIGIHATYLSMYVSLSVAIFLAFLVAAKNTSTRLLYSAAIIILLAGLLQLASKSVLIATVVFIS
jgi:O-antigen ligase